MHFDMNPDKPDRRLASYNKRPARRKMYSQGDGGFFGFLAFCVLVNLAIWGAIIYVVIHFIGKFW